MQQQHIGPVIIDLTGTELSQEEREILCHPLVGGVILFTRNYVTPLELVSLCQSLRKIRKLTPLLLVVDQEGGRVQRFREGFTRLPSMGRIGKIFDQSPSAGLKCAELCGWIMATEILSVGIDLSFAPVLDLNKQNMMIGDRAFHSKPSSVIELAKAFMTGMRKAGMAATGKHFPGHGSVSADSHHKLPMDLRPFNEIEADDLQSFQQMICAGLNAMMPAHIVFPEIDDRPAGYSSKWLRQILREKYHFSGMIISDDLNMNGASFAGDYPKRARMALEAGCDMILVCNNRNGAISILDRLPQDYCVDENKFKALQGKFSISFANLSMTRDWQEKTASFSRLMDGFQEFVF